MLELLGLEGIIGTSYSPSCMDPYITASRRRRLGTYVGNGYLLMGSPERKDMPRTAIGVSKICSGDGEI